MFCTINAEFITENKSALNGAYAQMKCLTAPLFVNGEEVSNEFPLQSQFSNGIASFSCPQPSICDPVNSQFSLIMPDGETFTGLIPSSPGPFTQHDLYTANGTGVPAWVITQTASTWTGLFQRLNG